MPKQEYEYWCDFRIPPRNNTPYADSISTRGRVCVAKVRRLTGHRGPFPKVFRLRLYPDDAGNIEIRDRAAYKPGDRWPIDGDLYTDVLADLRVQDGVYMLTMEKLKG